MKKLVISVLAVAAFTSAVAQERHDPRYYAEQRGRVTNNYYSHNDSTRDGLLALGLIVGGVAAIASANNPPPQVIYQQSPPVVVQQPPVQPPVYAQPQLYVQPAPVYVQPAPVYVQPAPVYQQTCVMRPVLDQYGRPMLDYYSRVIRERICYVN